MVPESLHGHGVSHRATKNVAQDAGISAMQLARRRKEAGDAYNAHEAMWTWPDGMSAH